MAILSGSGLKVDLENGFELRAPGVVGEANPLTLPIPGVTRARALEPEDGTDALTAALASTNLTEIKRVELKLERPAGPAPERALRSVDARQDVVEFLAPVPEDDEGQVVLTVDEHGVMTWHLPVRTEPGAPGATRGAAGPKQVFLIPATVTPPPQAAPGGVRPARGLIGLVGRKLLKVLIYPLTDPLLGPIEKYFAERWETKNRPYGLRTFTPANYKDPNAPALTADDFKRLAEKRALLFIHGTFSTAHGAFYGLCNNVLAELHKRYDGRVFAFNHFTLSHDPERNVQWFLGRLPPDCKLDVGIVCHSRGGLVARKLAERLAGNPTTNVKVSRIVFAGVPNAGTLLADKDHMVSMIDRLTTLTNLFPTGPVTEFLEGLITAVKVLGHAGLAGLPGLAAMDPRGKFLKALNTKAAVSDTVYGIAADYEPTDAGLKALVTGAADAVVDRIFENAANDLVVPQLGVFEKNGGSSFPIPPVQVLKIDKAAGVMHTTLFGYQPACDKILEWLTAS